MNIENVKRFMYVYGMSVAALAEHLRMPRTKLANKLNPNQLDKLSSTDEAAIKAYFLMLHKDTREFLATDLEELPEHLKE